MNEPCASTYKPGSHRDKVFAVLTSGSEIYGMNAAVRASVLMANFVGSKIYTIHQGFSGLIQGGDNIVEANRLDVTGIIHEGGTILGSGTIADFQDREGRLEAAYNLIIKNISYLIIIGSTMSMILSNLLKKEWIEYLNELYQLKRITKKQRSTTKDILHIIYVPSSIDNHYGADIITIGKDSALHRINQSIDGITGAPHSAQNIYILEVLGTKTGYLALVAAMGCQADYLFIPENPPKSDWIEKLCYQITMERLQTSHFYTIIIMAECAIDCNGNKITPQDVKKAIYEKLYMEAYITSLSQLQKGGPPSAFDRILGSRLGAGAVIFLVNSTNNDIESSVLTLSNNNIIAVPLPEIMKRVEAINEAFQNKNWELALRLNGQTFEEKLERYFTITRMKPSKIIVSGESHRFGILCIGSPTCGINAVIECVVRHSIHKGHTVLGIFNGIEGFVSGNIKELTWNDVHHLVSENGVYLGTRRMLPTDKYKEIAARITQFNINGLLIIGNFDAYYSCVLLIQQRTDYPALRIPFVLIPATISNNVPGTQICVGSDTSLNQITAITDRMNAAFSNSSARVFVIDIMGGYCGYLTTMSGIAVGAESTYINEEEFTIEDLIKDTKEFHSLINSGVTPTFLIMHSEQASTNYTIDFLRRLYAEESNGLYEVCTNVLGHVQQSGSVSPFDRAMGTKMAAMSVDWIASKAKSYLRKNYMGDCKSNYNDSACVLGIFGGSYKFTPVLDLIDDVDFERKALRNQWWLNFRPLLRILSNRGSLSPMTKDCNICKEKFVTNKIQYI